MARLTICAAQDSRTELVIQRRNPLNPSQPESHRRTRREKRAKTARLHPLGFQGEIADTAGLSMILVNQPADFH
jgi:hypothetical protein